MLIKAATACADEAAEAGEERLDSSPIADPLRRGSGLLPGAARARSFPSKQLRLLVGAAAGGGADIDPDQGAERARGAVGGQQGMETPASTASEAAAHIARETEIWKKVIADAGSRLGTREERERQLRQARQSIA
jgi:hypothetical protein